MSKTPKFYQKVYGLCRKVPKGKVTTYKILAEKLGTKAYRAVGAAMNKNPYGILNCNGKNMEAMLWEARERKNCWKRKA